MELVWDCFCVRYEVRAKKMGWEGEDGSLLGGSAKDREASMPTVESKCDCAGLAVVLITVQAGLECPIRQPLLLLMGICTVTTDTNKMERSGNQAEAAVLGPRGNG